MLQPRLIDYLIANPYSRETDFDKNLNVDAFLEEYFVECSSYADTTTQLNSVFEASSYQRMLSIFLYGYSGSGKTTYLRWYLKNYNNYYNTLFFDFSDSVEKKGEKEIDGTIKIFDKYFQDKLQKLFHSDSKSITKLLEGIYWRLLSIGAVFSTPFVKSLHSLLENSGGNVISHYDYYLFINELCYQDLLLLLLIAYYEYPILLCNLFKIEYNPETPLLLVLDNIDHIEIEHHNSNFPAEIEYTFSNLKSYYGDKQDSTHAKIHFIFCLRDANCTLINRQLGDVFHRVKIFFKPLDNISKIIGRRISIARKNGIAFSDEQNQLINLILNDLYSKKVFQPLFNFNYRKFAIFLSEVVQDYNTKYIDGINSLSNSEKTKNGARGIIFFLVIKYLLSNDYLKKRLFLDDGEKVGGDKGGNVNPARILLTNLHNLSRFSIDKFSNSPHVNPVGLYSLNRLFSEIFKNHDDLFFTVISDLFLFHRNNWCHLLTFAEKQVFTNNNFDEEKRLLKEAKQNNNEEAISKLDNIKLHINPSGFIYLRDIIRHYEFFSARAFNPKPLFSSIGFKIVGDKLEFEFIKNIDTTFELTEKCIKSLIKFLDAKVIQQFENTNHCFRTYHLDDEFNEEYHENQIGNSYLVRIIDTHIRYIDTLKHYLLEINPTYQNLIENPNNIVFYRNIKVYINKELTLRIEQYIKLLKESESVNAKNLINIFEKNLFPIKSDYNRYYSINTGRKDLN